MGEENLQFNMEKVTHLFLKDESCVIILEVVNKNDWPSDFYVI